MFPTESKSNVSDANLHDREAFLKLFGPVLAESGFKRRMRIHQGWWRMNVLLEAPGAHLVRKDELVCNTIQGGGALNQNFLTPAAVKAVDQTLIEREEHSAGLFERTRLYSNLLSSQPLCFNFFGELKMDTAFGLRVLQSIWPELTELVDVFFEFAPKHYAVGDNSALDVAFVVRAGERLGLIGMECKYTDSFSSTIYDKASYRVQYERSSSFLAPYDAFLTKDFNQLFRNFLIVDSALCSGDFDFVKLGLFCHPDDHVAINIGNRFSQMIGSDAASAFVLDYAGFVSTVQRIELSWPQREWTMKLWARYLATSLSQATSDVVEKS